MASITQAKRLKRVLTFNVNKPPSNSESDEYTVPSGFFAEVRVLLFIPLGAGSYNGSDLKVGNYPFPGTISLGSTTFSKYDAGGTFNPSGDMVAQGTFPIILTETQTVTLATTQGDESCTLIFQVEEYVNP